MLATRTRLSFGSDWLSAAVFLAATIVVGLLVIRELRVAPQAFATAAAQKSTTEAVPADAVSVPTLMLDAVNEIRVGDPAEVASARLGSGSVLVRTVSERGPLGPREVRSYEVAGTRFILVLEPFERRGSPRVAAIYLR